MYSCFLMATAHLPCTPASLSATPTKVRRTAAPPHAVTGQLVDGVFRIFARALFIYKTDVLLLNGI